SRASSPEIDASAPGRAARTRRRQSSRLSGAPAPNPLAQEARPLRRTPSRRLFPRPRVRLQTRCKRTRHNQPGHDVTTFGDDTRNRRSTELGVTTPYAVRRSLSDLQGGGRRFEACSAHSLTKDPCDETRRSRRTSRGECRRIADAWTAKSVTAV